MVVSSGDYALWVAANFLICLLYTSCRHVTLIHRRADFRADPILVEEARGRANLTLLPSTVVEALEGEDHLTGLTLRDTVAGDVSHLPVSALFEAVDVYKRQEEGKGQKLSAYQDGAAVPAWSREAVAWAADRGLWFSGSAETLAAGEPVTQEEDVYKRQSCRQAAGSGWSLSAWADRSFSHLISQIGSTTKRSYLLYRICPPAATGRFDRIPRSAAGRPIQSAAGQGARGPSGRGGGFSWVFTVDNRPRDAIMEVS